MGTKKKQVVIAVRSPTASGTKLNADMMALHNGSRVFVRKDDILKIFCDKPALYSVRLAGLVFGEETLHSSCMPEETNTKLTPLNEEILDSIISKFNLQLNATFSNNFIYFQLTSFKCSSSRTRMSPEQRLETPSECASTNPASNAEIIFKFKFQ